jgi:hypothetical protein
LMRYRQNSAFTQTPESGKLQTCKFNLSPGFTRRSSRPLLGLHWNAFRVNKCPKYPEEGAIWITKKP